MFQRDQLTALHSELKSDWFGKPEFEQLQRDVHLGIALYDAGRPLEGIGPVAVAIIEKYASSD